MYMDPCVDDRTTTTLNRLITSQEVGSSTATPLRVMRDESSTFRHTSRHVWRTWGKKAPPPGSWTRKDHTVQTGLFLGPMVVPAGWGAYAPRYRGTAGAATGEVKTLRGG
eukprot:CAMPEP_0180152678 /NCGR_PEP_ID=MMETSP0986-20121125/22962_1 /TAXON_ID=697907 /ORGANISM="non described non described, Strain CCMP2293" /LENGTH=109 /DNA_ID=CAMNT_0022100399 /DNA_START=298 /DNA_END=623 /DNA_ORIENTATION=-